MIQIIITKSSQPTYWYHNHIGQVLNAYERGDEWYIPYNGTDILFVRKDDAEIFDRKKKIERIKSKLV